MSTQVQFRRGNTTDTNAFTGAVAEVTVDTDKKVVVVHDGVTAGGFPAPSLAFAQSAFNKANDAYAAANTDLSLLTSQLTSNVTFIAAVNATQNTTLGVIFTKANSAYQSQNTTGTYANAAYTQANTATENALAASSYANSAYTNSNNISSLLSTTINNLNSTETKATAAFAAANTAQGSAAVAISNALEADTKALSAGSYANAAFLVANTVSSASSYANSAYTQANTATDNALSASTAANAAFEAANNAFTAGGVIAGNYANSAYTQANTATTNAAAASSYANSAFAVANTVSSASSYANSAFVTANTAVGNALAASTAANAAFIQANNSYGVANSALLKSTGGFTQANAAFIAANVGYNFVTTGGTITGPVVITDNLNVSGNITFGGGSTSITSNNLTLSDSLLYLASDNPANTSDIGIVGSFTQGYYQHTAVFRDHTDGRWKFVSNVISEPSTTMDITTARYDIIKSGGIETTTYANIGTVVYAGSSTGSLLGGATNPVFGALGSADNYIQSYIFNTANNNNSSSDYVAYPNNGTDASGWIDMGITSNNFTQATFSVTGRNEGYLFMSAPQFSGTSGNLVIATDSTGTFNSIEFYLAGFSQGKSSPALVLEGSRFKTNKPLVFSDNTIQNTSAAPFGYSNSSFLHANAAFNYSNTQVGLIGGIDTTQNTSITASFLQANAAFTKANAAFAGLSSDISANSLTSTSFVSLPQSKESTKQVWANTSGVNILVDTIDTTQFRSAKYQIQVSGTSDYQVSELLVLQTSVSDALVTEYAVVCSNTQIKTIGTYAANTSGGLVNLYFNPVGTTNKLIIHKIELSK